MAEVSFGEWLRRQRKASGWTQAELAQQVSCSTSTLKKIEAEERRPSEQIVDRLAEIFRIPSTERTDFLRFARGNWDAAPREGLKEIPWHVSPGTQQPPSGTVTFLFTDIEGSARLAREHADVWESLRRRHEQILHESIEAHHGYIFQVIGDAFCAAFPTAEAAVRAAVQAQLDLQAEPWEQIPIRIRIGIHTGKAEVQPDGQYGEYLTLSHVDRLMFSAQGGQILLSAATQELLHEHLPEGVSLRDLGEHSLKDSIRPEHVYQLVSEGLPIHFPPLKTLITSPTNLPGQLTRFIGREKELEELRELITTKRLITLTGIGGTGKTRLALQMAASMRNNLEDGVWLVELASLSDPSLVSEALLSTFNVQEPMGRSSLEVLKDYVSRKDLLLVLDNCEHLIEACAELVDALLRSTPQLKILATSREALGIAGETNYPVRALSLPNSNKPSADLLNQSEAVQLFVDRAISMQPGFEVTAQNAAVIDHICTCLDGIPLAIELAAARVRTMSVDEIARRLDDRFHLLTGGSRTALERHQTLRAAMDWSYNLLSDEEKILFASLSVFAAGWTLEAAEQVCGLSRNGFDVLAVLTRLIEKSLVILDESRYHMLETTRQYAREKLLASEEFKNLHDQHLAYFLELAEKAEPFITSEERPIWVDRLKRDYDNIRAALAWGRWTEKGLRLVGALRWFWEYAGMVREGRSWAEQAVLASSIAGTPVHAKALWTVGSMAWLQGDYASARRWLEESEQMWRLALTQAESEPQEQEARRGLARTLRKLGNILYSEKKFIEARSLKQSSINLFREVGTRWDLALDLHILGLILLELDDFASARTAFRESLSLFQQENDPWGIGVAFMDLGIMALRTNNLTDAETWFKESLTAVQQSPSPWSISRLLALLGTVAAHKHESARAAQLFGASDILREQMGFSQHTMHQSLIESGNESARQQLGEKEFSALHTTGRAMTIEQAIAYALRNSK